MDTSSLNTEIFDSDIIHLPSQATANGNSTERSVDEFLKTSNYSTLQIPLQTTANGFSSTIRSEESFKYNLPSNILCGSPENGFFEESDFDLHQLPSRATTDSFSQKSFSHTLRSGETIKSINPLDSVVTSVINSFIKRSNIGLKKYGTNLDRKDLSFLDWIQHAQEEHMDAILYLEKIKQMTIESSIKIPPLSKNCTSSTNRYDELLKKNINTESIEDSLFIPSNK